MFGSGLGSWDVGLVTSALDLSFGSWAFGPASFLIRNYVCFWTWTLERWTCHSSVGLVFLKLGLRPGFILKKKSYLFLDLEAGALGLSLQHWTCLFDAGLSTQLHSCKTCTCPQEGELVEASLGFHVSFRLSTNSAKMCASCQT